MSGRESQKASTRRIGGSGFLPMAAPTPDEVERRPDVAGGIYGADVAQLRELGDRLATSADELEQSGRLLAQSVTTTTQWKGPDAEGFRGDWNGTHHPQLARAVGVLRAAAQAARANADQQERASSADGAGRDWPLPGLGSFLGGWGSGQSGEPPADTGEPPRLDPDSGFRILPHMVGPQPDLWEPGVFSFMDERMPGAPDYYPATLENALGLLPGAGPVLSGVTIADTWMDPSSTAWERADSIIDVGADVVKDMGVVGYLSGVAIHTYTDVVDGLLEADFSASGLETTFDYIKNDPWGAVVSGSEAVVEYLPKLVGNLWPF